MINFRSIAVVLFLVLTITPVFNEAYGHSMFNSAESTIGGNRVQVATSPEFPELGKTSQILFRVTDIDLKEVDRFTLGVRIFYNGQQIDAIAPKSYQGAHAEIDYIWQNSGNHIVKVDLYDMKGSPGVVTHTFNMGTQSPFGFIFFIAITIGALTLLVVLIYIYIPEKLRFLSRS